MTGVYCRLRHRQGHEVNLHYTTHTHTPHLTCVVFTSGQARTRLPHSPSGQVLVDSPTWAHLTCWADFLGKRWLHLTGNWFLINIAKNKSTSHDSPTGLFIHFEVQEGKNMKRQLGFLCGFFFPPPLGIPWCFFASGLWHEDIIQETSHCLSLWEMGSPCLAKLASSALYSKREIKSSIYNKN